MARELSEVEQLVAELESRLDRLRALYEQYFLGYEKLEPLVPRKDVERRFDVLRRSQFRNTALRFRFQQSQQKYNTYLSYWGRITRQIETGTYIRHVNRVRAAQNPVNREVAREPELEVDFEDLETDLDETFRQLEEPATTKRSGLLDIDDPFSSAQKQQTVATSPGALPSETKPLVRPKVVPKIQPKAATVASAAPATTGSKPGTAPATAAPKPAVTPAAKPMPAATVAKPVANAQDAVNEARIREVYTEYVKEKRAHKESTADITYEKVAKSIRESSAALSAKHGGKRIDFEVTQRDGKTVLKPIVK
jgi:hypothetical protein